MSKKWWVVFLAVVVVAAGYIGYSRWSGNETKSPVAETPDVSKQVAVVERGSLEMTVDGTGSIEAAREVELAFPQAGRVAEVAVKAGQQVQAGDVLARLDTTELELKVKQAEAGLESAQAQLKQAMDKPTTEDVAAAKAAYFTALEQYHNLLDSPSEEEVEIAKAALEKAKAALQQAQAAYDKVASRPNAAMLPQALNLQNATLDYEKALAQYKQATEKPSEEKIVAAKENLEKAKAHLEDVKNGPTPEELAIKQASVKQAEAGLALAKRNLDNATLRAPFAGTVTEVNVEPGQIVGSNKAVITLSDLSHLQATLYVDETDVGQVSEGQEVTISLDAFPDAEIRGTVTGVGLSPEVQSGVVLYPVTVDLAPAPVPIRPGMTADGEIIVKSEQDALLIPLSALHEIGGRTIVFVKAQGEEAPRRPPAGRAGEEAKSGRKARFAEDPVFKALVDAGFRPVRVTLGTVTDTQAEVLSGLSEGDIVSTVPLTTQSPSGKSETKAPKLLPLGRPR